MYIWMWIALMCSCACSDIFPIMVPNMAKHGHDQEPPEELCYQLPWSLSSAEQLN